MDTTIIRAAMDDKTAATVAKKIQDACTLNTALRTFDGNRQHKTYLSLKKEYSDTVKDIHAKMDETTFALWDTIEKAFDDGMINRLKLAFDGEKKSTTYNMEQVVFSLQDYLDVVWDESQRTEFAEKIHTACMALTAFTFNDIYYDRDDEFDKAVYDLWCERFACTNMDIFGRNATERAIQAVVDMLGLNVRITKTVLREMAHYGNVLSYSDKKNVITMADDKDMIRILTLELVHLVSGTDFEVLKKHSK